MCMLFYSLIWLTISLNSANISTLIETDKKDESILTVESTGALDPEKIILAGVDEVSKRLGEFKDMINQIKE